jgi:hypothetical protein
MKDRVTELKALTTKTRTSVTDLLSGIITTRVESFGTACTAEKTIV